MKKRILLLEDEIGNQKLLNFILAGEFNLNIVENGLEAVNWLNNNTHPDLIIMDWIMPIMDGKSFLTMLKQTNLCPNIPIIVLSSYEYIHSELASIPFEANAKLKKPVNSSVLKTAIADALLSINS
ncbi:MAG TPA: response regulator [Sphingobacteriaceae bacterium]|jgi:CheY-like chemotaxis protein|nr:response regulator [Sphingobacteriaceae bacterium]